MRLSDIANRLNDCHRSSNKLIKVAYVQKEIIRLNMSWICWFMHKICQDLRCWFSNSFSLVQVNNRRNFERCYWKVTCKLVATTTIDEKCSFSSLIVWPFLMTCNFRDFPSLFSHLLYMQLLLLCCLLICMYKLK